MAAFSYDSFLAPKSSNNMSNFYEEGIINTCCSPMMPNHGYLQEIPSHVQIHETSMPLYKGCSDLEVPFSCTTDPCFSTEVKLDSNSSSVVVEQLDSDSVDQVTQAATSTQRKAKERSTKRLSKGQKKVPEGASTGYVHVRARRGEATDKHSLAERSRREKIRERKKLLQSLVPGCDKLSGEILTLDHIIKYVQALQTQVEFLAAKLASPNPICISDFEVDFDTNTLAQTKICSSDFQLPPVLESSSTQLTSFPDESTALIAPDFLLLDQEQRSNITFQDNGNLLWGSTDDSRRHGLANYFRSDDFSSFWW